MRSSKSRESCVFAGERRMTRGMPRRSTTRWRFEPGLPRSVGFGPVSWPPFLPGCSRHQGSLVTSRSGQRLPTSPTAAGGAAPRHRLPATPPAGASMSARCPSPVPPAACSMAARSAARR
jgi:hypothetical protein